MQKETPTTATPSEEFTIPVELLKTFKSDVRMLKVGPNNGYIIFDKSMMQHILTRGTEKERMDLATQLDNLGKAGGELVIMQTR